MLTYLLTYLLTYREVALIEAVGALHRPKRSTDRVGGEGDVYSEWDKGEDSSEHDEGVEVALRCVRCEVVIHLSRPTMKGEDTPVLDPVEEVVGNPTNEEEPRRDDHAHE